MAVRPRRSARHGTSPTTIGGDQFVGHEGGVRLSQGRRVLGQQVVPDDQPRPEELGLTLGTREEPDVQVGAAVTDALDVAPADVRQNLDVSGDVRAEHAQLGREVVREVREIVMVTRVEHEGERHSDPADLCQPPAVVEPDALVAAPAGPAVRRVFPVPGRFRNHGRSEPRHPQAVGLEGADVPAGHPRQRQALFVLGSGDGMGLELLGRPWHAQTLTEPPVPTAAAGNPILGSLPSRRITRAAGG